jgi:hypothetical protein
VGQRDDDGVVGVAEYRYEVGDDVDRDGQVAMSRASRIGTPRGMAPAACASRIPHRLTWCGLVAGVGQAGPAMMFLARMRWRCGPIVVYIVYIGQIAEMQRRRRARAG